MKQIQIKSVGKLVITENLEKIIDSLHGLIGNNEWSGILFYKLTSGEIKNMKDLVFEADHIHPMDIGTHSHTGFSYNEEIVEPYNMREELIEWSNGLVHTHHSMTAFFSSTDIDELKDNAKYYNYYLSLVVDFRKTYKAKIVFPSKSKETYTYNAPFKDDKGNTFIKKYKIEKEEEEILYVSDLEIVMPEVVNTYPQYIIDRVDELKEKKRQASVVKHTPVVHHSPGYYQQKFYDGYDDIDWMNNNHKEKKSYSLNTDIEKFIVSLIHLDDSKCNSSIYSAFNQVTFENDDEEEIYETMLAENIDILHFNLFGTRRVLSKDLEDVIAHLEDRNYLYKDKPVYSTLMHVLNEYETV